MKKITTILIITFLLVLSACTKRETSVRYENVTYDYFDTVSYLYNYGDDDQQTFDKYTEETFEILKNYHQLTDIYHEYGGINNIYTINSNAGKAVEVSDELITFLKYCKDIYKLTDGKTNVMLGAVLRLWHAYREEGTSIPTIEELNEAYKHCGIDLLIIDEEAKTVTLLDEQASLDVGAIAKGYAIEKAAEYLIANKRYGYVIDVGGNIKTIGTKADNEPYVMGITNPLDTTSYIFKFELNKNSCATSGNYERFYVVDGIKYHHIIDEDTLYPANYFASVSVICDDAGLTDALSTALFTMTYEEGKQFISQLTNVDAIWIDNNNEVQYSSGIVKVNK